MKYYPVYTWRIGPHDGRIRGFHNHGDRGIVPFSDRVVGPLPNGRTSWLINAGDPNHLQVLG